MAGALAGLFCTRVAACYAVRLLHGATPDAATLRMAFAMAWYVGRPATLRAAYDRAGAAADICAGPIPAMRGASRYAATLRRALPAAVLAGGFMALYQVQGCSPYTALAALAGFIVMLLSLIDMRTGLLPDALTLPLLGLGIASAGLADGGHRWAALTGDAAAGAILGWACPWLLMAIFKRIRGRDGMGGGDLKLLAALGAWLGWQGLPAALLLACVGGLLWAMWAQRSLLPAGSYPFGPFLAAGGAYVFLAGSGLHWHYF
jgi:leader peptidase (prepilin peptidase)/N-methyltransferase